MRSVIYLFALLVSMGTSAVQSIGPDRDALLKLSEQASQGQYQGAVLLNKTMHSSVDENGLETYTMYVAIKILDDEAERDYSKLSFGYNAHYMNRTLEFARVILNDGSVKPISKDAMQVTNVGSNDSSFDDIQTLRFAVPAVKKGNIIELQHRSVQHRPIIDDHWFSQFSFHYIHNIEDRNWARIDALLESDLQVDVANALPVSWTAQGLNKKPKVTKTEAFTSYKWHLEAVPAVKVEANMGNFDSTLSKIRMTSLPSWKNVDSWAWGFLEQKIDTSPELHSLALKIVANADAQTEQQKIAAVFHYVQDNVRYIGAHVGRGGYEPHKATEVLTQSYGDCKDQTTLIVALLKQLGITAYPALISPGPDTPVDPQLPLLQFSHMITYVPQNQAEAIWLDTSGSTGDFPGIFGNLEGQTAFVVNGQGGKLDTIPLSTPSDNKVEMRLRYIKQDSSMTMQAIMTLRGHLDTSVRNMYVAAPDKTDFVRRLMSTFVTEQNISDFQTTDVEDWQQDFTLTINYTDAMSLPEDLAKFNYSDTMMSMINAFTDFSYIPDPKDKVHGFSLAFPFELVMQRDYPNVVENGELAGTQLATQFHGEYVQLTHKVDMDDQRIATETTLSVDANLLTNKQYKAFYAEVEKVKADSSSYFVYSNSLKATPVKEGQQDDVSALLKHTRELLSIGEFSKALSSSQQLIKLAPNNGEAFYLHGLSLGFDNQLEASERAFEQAETLGYVEDAL